MFIESKIMKIGDKILVPNWIVFEKKSDAIAATVVNKIHEKIIEKMDGIYPDKFDMEDWTIGREIQDLFTLDDITIVQVIIDNRLFWIWKYDQIENESEQ